MNILNMHEVYLDSLYDVFDSNRLVLFAAAVQTRRREDV